MHSPTPLPRAFPATTGNQNTGGRCAVARPAAVGRAHARRAADALAQETHPRGAFAASPRTGSGRRPRRRGMADVRARVATAVVTPHPPPPTTPHIYIQACAARVLPLFDAGSIPIRSSSTAAAAASSSVPRPPGRCVCRRRRSARVAIHPRSPAGTARSRAWPHPPADVAAATVLGPSPSSRGGQPVPADAPTRRTEKARTRQACMATMESEALSRWATPMLCTDARAASAQERSFLGRAQVPRADGRGDHRRGAGPRGGRRGGAARRAGRGAP